jgi:hypothetical protein
MKTHDDSGVPKVAGYLGEHDDDLVALVVRADARGKEQAAVAGERKPTGKGCKTALRNKRAFTPLKDPWLLPDPMRVFGEPNVDNECQDGPEKKYSDNAEKYCDRGADGTTFLSTPPTVKM